MKIIKRRSNIELLRIISMFMIFVLHFIQGTDALKNAIPGSINYFIFNFLEALSIVAVNCFILVSGYFFIKFDFKKILKLILQVKTYAIILPIICILLGVDLGGKEILQSLFPIIFRQYWFFNIYLALYLLSPILNYLISKLSKEQFKKINIILFLIFSLFNSIYPTFNSEGGHGLYNFIFLYLVGAYIKLYFNININKYKCLIIYIISSLLIVAGNYTVTIFTKNNSTMFFNYDNVLVVISSIALFILFKEINISSNIINNIARFSFGTYIIHANIFVWNLIVSGLSSINLNSTFVGVTCIVVAFSGFVTCILIEIIRYSLFNKIEDKIINCKLLKKLINNINSFFNLLIN